MTKTENHGYKILSNEFRNTGGGCMVTCVQVYDSKHNRTLTVYVDDESISICTCDYLNQEFDFKDRMQLNYDDHELDTTSQYYDLYRDCLQIYARHVARQYKRNTLLDYESLSEELQKTVPAGYEEWFKENIGDYFETNGEYVIIEKEFSKLSTVNEIEEFIKYMDKAFDSWSHSTSEAADMSFYSLPVTLNYGEKTLSLGNNAESFSAIQEMLIKYINMI